MDDSLFLKLMKIVDAAIDNVGTGVSRESIRYDYSIGPDAEMLIDFALNNELIFIDDETGYIKPRTKTPLGKIFWELSENVSDAFRPRGEE